MKAWSSRAIAVGVLTAVVATLPDRSQAQYCFSDSASREARGTKTPKLVYGPDSLYELAVKLAPTLRFSPGETYFPTIPFFRAFDTRENATGTWTSGKLDTIANLRPDSSLSWNTLDSAYALRQTPQHFTEEQVDSVPKPTTTAVFFRADCLDVGASERVWQFLQNDAQAWMRSRPLRDLYVRDTLYKAVFQVLEYYFHYVHDTGLEGHPGDLEAVFVFVPRVRGDTSQSQAKAKRLDNLMIIVGQGHSASTPNNVLVLTGQEARHVRKNGWHSMVELGGHSSAPDRNRDGQFSPGFDANWNINEKMWGTRDAQAVSGTGYLGRYESWMTLPRSHWNSVTLEKDPDNLARLLQTKREGPRVDSSGVGRAGDRGYLLLPVSLLQRLFSVLEDVPPSSPVPDSLRTTIVGLVNGPLATLLEPWGFKGFEPSLAPEDTDAIIRRMVFWTKEPTWRTEGRQGRDVLELITGGLIRKSQRGVPTERIQIWTNRAAVQTADRILKANLFRPSVTLPREHGAPARSSIRQFGYMVYEADLSPGGGKGVQAGILLPYFIPLRAATRSLDTPGIFEYKAGLYFSGSLDRVRPAISVTYDRHYKSFLSWFVAYSWVYHRRHLESDATSSAMIVGGSFMPLFPFADSKVLGPPATHLRVRTGIRLEIRSWRPIARRIALEALYYWR